MAIWTCTDCGASERLNFTPDCCSFCRGMMESQDGRTTAGIEGGEAAANEAIRCEAEYGCESSIIALWQMGERLSSAMSMTIDEMLVHNRVAMLEAVYRGEAA